MTPDILLSRLNGVRQTGPGRWLARCPAHDDRSPSLSIREVDGRVLLHDFGGCDTGAVLAAVGLRMGDLFEKSCDSPPSRSAIPVRDVLQALDHEILVACLLLDEILEFRCVDETHWSRLAQCAARIGAARDSVSPLKG